MAIILVAVGTFLLCWLLDKGFQKAFRSAPQHMSGKAEQSGNYIAVKATAVEGAVITAEVIGGDHGPVTLDEDGILIARIKNTSQKLQFKAITAEGIQTITYSLAGLTLTE